jgi:hypothetical protein
MNFIIQNIKIQIHAFVSLSFPSLPFFSTKILILFLISPMNAMQPAQLISPDFMILLRIRNGYNLWRSRNFLQSPATSLS